MPTPDSKVGGLRVLRLSLAIALSTMIQTAGVMEVSAKPSQAASDAAPLRYIRSIEIPDVPLGPYSDTMALDIEGSRLFATPQAAKAVAVLDLKHGVVAKMISGIGNPHAILYLGKLKRLFVVDGATGSLRVFDTDSYELVKNIDLAKGADMGAYDERSGIFYINISGEKMGLDHSLVYAVDTKSMTKIAEIKVPGTDVEGSVVDPDGQRLYVNLSEKSAVAVIDLKKRALIATWQLPGTDHAPYSAAVDTKRNRLYVACRNFIRGPALHGSIMVLDLSTGRTIKELPIGGWTDGIFLDARRHRIYSSSGTGVLETYLIQENDRFTKMKSVDTALLGKTSLFSGELDRMFVTIPQLGSVPAQVMIFEPR